MIKILTVDGNIRRVGRNEAFRLAPGEKVVGSDKGSEVRSDDDDLHKVADQNKMGVGDLINALTTSTGFKKWWDDNHKGECAPCQKRRASANYIKFKSPSWLSKWIKGYND